MQGDAEDNHMEGGEKVSRRGRKPGSGRRNGGTAGKGKDPKQSGTDSEQDVSWRQNVAFSQVWLSGVCAMQAPAPYLHFTAPPVSAVPLPVPAPTGTVPVALPPAPHALVQAGEEEDYDS
ncbi:putative Dr1-associated corepressor protein [Naja naja]|nr:putative Dr1-associated corepressor protein [Naja naja]